MNALLRRHIGSSRVVAWLAAVFGVCLLAIGGGASAQPLPGGLLPVGSAAVSGFSGVAARAGASDASGLYIDPEGISIRVFDLRDLGGPADGRLVTPPKLASIPVGSVGQVFGLAIDTATPPNLYASATSLYGLPIVGPNGERLHAGAPGARFMDGLYGPAAAGGGPGAIWKVDGASGAVSLFASTSPDNAGPALGGLAFDAKTRTLYAADRETGLVHAFDPSGHEIGRYDHGVTGRTAAGLSPVAFDPAGRMDVASPAFSPDQPATWGLTRRERLIFGLGVDGDRLYYAVADGLQVWSVAIGANGALGADARLELAVPPGDGPTEISKIVFDARGTMILAERPAPIGAFDFGWMAQEGTGRVLRYAPADPPATGWRPAFGEYAIGFPLTYRNGNGGVAIGPTPGFDGRFDPGSCGGTLWTTGERLRLSSDPATAEALKAKGAEDVDGLQGNAVAALRPVNEPPWASWFVDFDDRFGDPNARGHMGDVAMPLACSGLPMRWGWSDWWRADGFWIGGRWGGGRPFLPPPPTTHQPCGPKQPCECPSGTSQQHGAQCCTIGTVVGADGACQSLCAHPPKAPSPDADVEIQVLCWRGWDLPSDLSKFDPNDVKCWDGSKAVVVQGDKLCKRPPGATCPAGFENGPANAPDALLHWLDSSCVPTAAEKVCLQTPSVDGYMSPGPDGKCGVFCPQLTLPMPVEVCCPIGTVAWPDGTCRPPKDQKVCPDGKAMIDGKCDRDRRFRDCPDGKPPVNGTCDRGDLRKDCPSNWVKGPNGLCCPPQGIVGAKVECFCTGDRRLVDGVCVGSGGGAFFVPQPQTPPAVVVPILPRVCPTGQVKTRSGECCPRGAVVASGACCVGDLKPSRNGRTCVPRWPSVGGPAIVGPGIVKPPTVVRPPIVHPPKKVIRPKRPITVAPPPPKKVIIHRDRKVTPIIRRRLPDQGQTIR